jgi:hypothetical protein
MCGLWTYQRFCRTVSSVCPKKLDKKVKALDRHCRESGNLDLL